MNSRWCFILFILMAAAACLGLFFCATAGAQTVRALAPEECRVVRAALERALPIRMGFRMARESFEDRALGLAGTRCRLMLNATGYAIESRSGSSGESSGGRPGGASNAGSGKSTGESSGKSLGEDPGRSSGRSSSEAPSERAGEGWGEARGIRGLGDLRAAMEEALKAQGWRLTPDLLRYMADGPTGTAFAYGREGAVCRVSINVDALVEGACPEGEPIDLYGNCGLKPWERGVSYRGGLFSAVDGVGGEPPYRLTFCPPTNRGRALSWRPG